MAKRRNRSQKKEVNIWLSLALALFSFFAASRLGFVGRLSANIFRFFVGDLYVLAAVACLILALVLMFQQRVNWKKHRARILGLFLIIIAILIFTHAWAFGDQMGPEISAVQLFFQAFQADLASNQQNYSLGGGLIGGVIYQLSYFLFSEWGTYLIAFLLVFFGVLLFTHTTLKEVGNFLGTVWGKVSSLFQSLVVSVRDYIEEMRDENRQRDQVDQEPVHKAPAEKKTAPQAERKPIEIEAFQPTLAHGMEAAEELEAYKKPADEDQAKDSRLDEEAELEAKDTKSPEPEVESGDGDFEIVAEEENEDYKLPPISLLDVQPPADQSKEFDAVEKNIAVLNQTFESFQIDAEVVKVNIGPSVTVYEVEPGMGVKVSKIEALAKDISLALAAPSVRIEAPIPGKSLVGIEVPNIETAPVTFREVIEETQDKYADDLLKVPLGRDVSGQVVMAELNKMPHLLVAGATGSGKSVGINGIIGAILMKAKPNQVKFMMIDPKMVELSVYNDIPHLLTPVVTNPKKAAQALNKVVQEMDRRYELLSQTGQRNFEGYNDWIEEKARADGQKPAYLPYIVVVVDELADLMMVAGKEVEDAITRLAQKARAAGIHMVLATQRPSVDVITGSIKANIPSRIAFAVSSGTDSRTILDQNGAEKLLGRGDMLFKPIGANHPIRVQGSYISDDEVERLIDFVKNQQEPNYVEEMIPDDEPETGLLGEETDELFDEAVEVVVAEEKASTSLLQRRLRIGYNRAANIIDEMEARGIISPADGNKPREVYLRPSEEAEDPEDSQSD